MIDNKDKEEIKIVEIPTQTTLAFQVGDRVLSQHELLAEIYKDVQSLKKLIA